MLKIGTYRHGYCWFVVKNFSYDGEMRHDGETHIDEGWRDNPRFATDSTIPEAYARLQLSIAGLKPSVPTMTMG